MIRDTTAMNIKKPAPGVVFLYEKGYITNEDVVYDYGAGYGRNAKYLRHQNIETYAYDPFHGVSTSGHECVSNRLMTRTEEIQSVTVILTSYVLNVLPKEDEDHVLYYFNAYFPQAKQYNITRNDLLPIATKLYPEDDPQDTIVKGFYTKKGFQRHVWLQNFGDPNTYAPLYINSRYIVWEKK